jgi:hypothetical protein
MQQEDEEAGDVVVGVGVQSQIHETVHAVSRSRMPESLGISRSSDLDLTPAPRHP